MQLLLRSTEQQDYFILKKDSSNTVNKDEQQKYALNTIHSIKGNHGVLNYLGVKSEPKSNNSSQLINNEIKTSKCQLKSNERNLDEEVNEEERDNIILGGKRGNPTGIAKTEVKDHELWFGARYKHTLKSSGGSLGGLYVTEKVTKTKDDFKSGLPDVKIGKHVAEINRLNQISDKIWISFGAIAPAVKRLKKERKPGTSLLGEEVCHQELYYGNSKKTKDWKKFADVTIKQQLYDIGDLMVKTIDNGNTDAKHEEFTSIPPRIRKQLHGE